MKTILTTLFLTMTLFAFSETQDTMLIHKTDGSILKVALADIDSTTFIQVEMKSKGFVPVKTTPGAEITHYYEIEAISKDIAYLVTSHNKLFKTIDGGESWNDISPEWNSGFDIKGVTPQVSFYDENIGAVAFSVDDGSNGYNYSIVFGYVWCTTDGGATWSQRFDVNQDQILHLEQVSATVLYVSGTARYGVSNNKWFKKITRNAADNLFSIASISSMPSAFPHTMGASWLNENEGIALGKNNTHAAQSVFLTRNGGSSWSEIKGNLPFVDKPSYMYCSRSIKMLSTSSFIYVCRYKNSGVYITKLWRTDDSGVNWMESSFDEAPSYLYSLDFADNGVNGIVLGHDTANYYYETFDGGYNWKKADVSQKMNNQGLTCPEIADDGTVWLTGFNKGLWKKSALTSANPTSPKSIPMSFLNESEWKAEWFVVYSDTTMGYDFSAKEYNNTNRDAFLHQTEMKFINSFLFDGENRIKKLASINSTENLSIPQDWDMTNNKLEVGMYYLAQCNDGYVIFKVNSYMDCCAEFEITFTFIPNEMIK